MVVLLFNYYTARVRFFLISRDGVLLLFKYCSARVRFFLIPRDVVVLLFNYYTARVRLCVLPSPCHSERSRGISWKRMRQFGFPPTPSSERSEESGVAKIIVFYAASPGCFDKLNMTENFLCKYR